MCMLLLFGDTVTFTISLDGFAGDGGSKRKFQYYLCAAFYVYVYGGAYSLAAFVVFTCALIYCYCNFSS